MVWPATYEKTRELWQEGNVLRIEGKVKIKEERVQITCDGVEIYQPGAPVPQVKAAAPQIAYQARPFNGNLKNGYNQGQNSSVYGTSVNGKPVNGKTGNGHVTNEKNGKMPAQTSNSTANGSTSLSSPPVSELHKITITIHETEDEEKDEAFINQLMDILKENRGKDEVNLRVVNEVQITNLKLTAVYVNYSPDLQKRLEKLVGPDSLKVETLTG